MTPQETLRPPRRLHDSPPSPAPAGEIPWTTVAAELPGWCERWLGARPRRTFRLDGRLSIVVGVQLSDGRRAVVKVRPASQRLVGCAWVQAHLSRAGSPVPAPLAGPVPLGDLWASAEAMVGGGHQLPRGPWSPAAFARALAALVRAAPAPARGPSLDPPPAWLWWDHLENGLWPRPQTTPRDLNRHPGPAWLDELAGRARSVLCAGGLGDVVGHGDFESQNVRWWGGRLHVVHDWDSAVCAPEAAIAGAAATVFPTRTHVGDTAGLRASRAFMASYAAARGSAWSRRERQTFWAAGTWVAAYAAKVALAEGRGGPALRLRKEAQRRAELVGG